MYIIIFAAQLQHTLAFLESNQFSGLSSQNSTIPTQITRASYHPLSRLPLSTELERQDGKEVEWKNKNAGSWPLTNIKVPAPVACPLKSWDQKSVKKLLWPELAGRALVAWGCLGRRRACTRTCSWSRNAWLRSPLNVWSFMIVSMRVLV